MTDPREMVKAAEATAWQARQRDELSEAELQTVVDALRQAPSRLRWRASSALADLATHFPLAQSMVLKLATDPSWSVRFRAMHCLRRQSPRDWAAEVVRVGLTDRHFRVRYWAAEAALSLRLTEVVPDLERSLQAETNATVIRYATRRALPFLRDGFLLEDDGGPVCVLEVITPTGQVGRGVTREELQERGLAALVAELQSHGT